MGRFTLFLSLASLAVPSFALTNRQLGNDVTYDYVVVGGGTAGLAIAARLAESPDVTIAVVEAGGHYETEGGPLSIIPGFAGTANTGTDPSDVSPIDWNFVAEPLAEANNRELRYARGKTLGGSSARHYMVYQRGTKGTYDQWADITGDSSWEWDSVLPYFKKSCELTPVNMTGRFDNTSVTYNPAAFDPAGAPLQVTWPNFGSPFSTYVETGLESIGVLSSTDFNSGNLNGSAWASITINPQSQKRDSSETSFLNSAVRNSSPLQVYEHTMATRLLFDGTTATGVLVESAGVPFTINARKEVIVSAGAFQSPQLLMVSGIGPRDILESHNIPVLQDLPGVGQNLWDHPMFGVVHVVNLVTTTRLLFDPPSLAEAFMEYSVQQGPLTSPGFGVLGWERLPSDKLTDSAKEDLEAFPADWPEVEYLSVDGILDGWHSAADQLVGHGEQYASIAAALVAPLSRGNISISSANAHDAPIINLNYLEHPTDQEVAIAAVKRLRAAWKGAAISIGPEYSPGEEVQTDEEILEFLRESISPVFHAAGTCAMGKASDPNAVVDSNAKVFGINRLRVVDASIMPTLPAGHPQSSIYMVAEKIAAEILNGN
ncbi:hypothetical protein BDW59DRAFT_143591 [Aspergillus cavernicola]|uniref:Glucose-methanol-choline oxidoreductase N-terminal domain-containing protein n=1 Tax=Aspergillus cavernicola TaxID=176166 RepID=A0ABR4IJL6_9EURO